MRKIKSKVIVLRKEEKPVTVSQADLSQIFERCFNSVRPELQENTYILEALKVLPVGGYRSAIGSFWNAVVDDLRNKIIARSLRLFNKSANFPKEIKNYEDFQSHVNDDQLIDGAYAIGVIGWEASRVLKHAKETRHIFDGHPRSGEPSVIKVLAMMDDCVRYVLNADYPQPIIDIDEYINMLATQQFDRNSIAVENALGSLPEIYKEELANRLFGSYISANSTTTLRSNIEFVGPLLWQVLPKEVKLQIVRKIDQEISKGNVISTEQAFTFVKIVSGGAYLSPVSRKYKVFPLVKKLSENLDKWKEENKIVEELLPYANIIPQEILSEYVSTITHTYVGCVGSSFQYSRTDFYADEASSLIPQMFQIFDDKATEAFVDCIKHSGLLRDRIRHPAKMRRLRSLGNIALERVTKNFSGRSFLEALVDEKEEELFVKLLPVLKR